MAAALTATRSFPSSGKNALCTVTAPARGLYVLSMHGLPDNRLSPVSCDAAAPSPSFEVGLTMLRFSHDRTSSNMECVRWATMNKIELTLTLMPASCAAYSGA